MTAPPGELTQRVKLRGAPPRLSQARTHAERTEAAAIKIQAVVRGNQARGEAGGSPGGKRGKRSTLGKRDSSWYLVNGQHGGLSFKSENYPDRTGFGYYTEE